MGMVCHCVLGITSTKLNIEFRQALRQVGQMQSMKSVQNWPVGSVSVFSTSHVYFVDQAEMIIA